MSDKDVQLEIVWDDNGVTNRVVVDPEKVNITNKEQAEAYAMKKLREEGRDKDSRGNFLIGRNDNLIELEASGLTITDRRYFMQLAIYAQFDGKPLMKDGKPLTTTDISELWNLNYAGTVRRLNKFVENQLLNKMSSGKNRHYVLNEHTFLMGKGVKSGEKFVKLFQNKLAHVIERIQFIEEVEAKKNENRSTEIIDVIGILQAVMPYFHYQTYYLVTNPNEDILQKGEKTIDALDRNPKVLKHLSKAQIGRILGYKKMRTKTVDTYMDYLQKAGAVMITEVSNKRRYLIHPDLMFRLDTNGLDDYTKYVRNQFNQHS